MRDADRLHQSVDELERIRDIEALTDVVLDELWRPRYHRIAELPRRTLESASQLPEFAVSQVSRWFISVDGLRLVLGWRLSPDASTRVGFVHLVSIPCGLIIFNYFGYWWLLYNL